MRKFNAVVVGTGFIGPVHVEALKRANVHVAGIVGSTPEKSQQAAEDLGLAKGYASLEDVLADNTIHAVHLATPNRLHFEQAKAVLLAGKHVLCEKPLAMNSQQTTELVELAAEKQLAAGVAYNIRFYPLCHEAAARVANGSIGEVLHIHGSYVQDWLLFDTDYNWRVEAEAGGALRAVADIGTHWLDLVQFIANSKVVEVFADLRTVHAKRKRPVGGAETFSGKKQGETDTVAVDIDTEDCGSILLRFENGANGSLWVSQTTAGRKNCLRFEIGGSKSSLAFNSQEPNKLWIGHRDSANEILLRDGALMNDSAAALANYPGGHNEGFPDTFKQLFKSFYQYVKAGDFSAPEPFPTFAQGHYEVLLCEAILKSHSEQRWVEVGD